jgi:hypothetical protein
MKRIQGTAKSMGFRVRAFGLLAMIAAGQTLSAQQAIQPVTTQQVTPPGMRPPSGTGHTTAEQAAANVAAHGTPTTTAMVGVASTAAPAKAQAPGSAPTKPAVTPPGSTTPPQ